MLEQLVRRPFGPVAEFNRLDHVDEADKRHARQEVGQGDLVIRARDLQCQGVRRTVAQEIDIGPANIVDELQPVHAGACEQAETVVGVLDHVMSVTTPENIGIIAFEAGQVIVTGSAIECIVVEKAVDRIVIFCLRVFQHAGDDLGKFQACPIFENESFDQIGCDIFQPVITAENLAKQAEIGTHPAELADDIDNITGLAAIRIEHNDLEIVTRSFANQFKIVGGNVAPETEKIDTRLDRTE